MADGEGENLGLNEAHTPAENFGGGDRRAGDQVDPVRAAKVGSGKAQIAADMADLAAQLVPDGEAEQMSMMLDEQDEQLALFSGPVAHVASAIEASRGRGRPKGSQNRANAEFRDVLLRMGYRHPGLNLAALANADPVKLAQELSPTNTAGMVIADLMVSPLETMKLIMKANAELLPYFESKRPTEIKVDRNTVGVMIIGDMRTEEAGDDDIIDVTSAPSPD